MRWVSSLHILVYFECDYRSAVTAWNLALGVHGSAFSVATVCAAFRDFWSDMRPYGPAPPHQGLMVVLVGSTGAVRRGKVAKTKEKP